MAYSRPFFLLATVMLLLLLLAGESHGRSLRRRSGKRAHGVRGKRAHGGGYVCRGADYPALCRAMTHGTKGAYAATQAVVRRLAASTTAAKRAVSAKKRGIGADVAYVCIENYEDAEDSLGIALSDMGKRDKGGFNSEVSAALSDYVTCEDTFKEMGVSSPLSQTNIHLRKVASTALYLATLWH